MLLNKSYLIYWSYLSVKTSQMIKSFLKVEILEVKKEEKQVIPTTKIFFFIGDNSGVISYEIFRESLLKNLIFLRMFYLSRLKFRTLIFSDICPKLSCLKLFALNVDWILKKIITFWDSII